MEDMMNNISNETEILDVLEESTDTAVEAVDNTTPQLELQGDINVHVDPQNADDVTKTVIKRILITTAKIAAGAGLTAGIIYGVKKLREKSLAKKAKKAEEAAKNDEAEQA